jgi:hypothetical protein
MKKIIFSLLALVMVASFSNKVAAQVTLTSNTAGAELVKVLTIVNTTPLHFGTIGITAGTAGSVVMTTGGVRTAVGAGTTLINTGTQKTVALFTLSGTADDNYTIALPETIALTTGDGIGATKQITVSTLKVKEGSQAEEAWAASIQGTLTAGGTASFLVGGTIPFAADQVIGVYAGSYSVTVDYE